jgi:inorganic pyrophosphatase
MKLPQPLTQKESINIVIETPKGGRNKFTYDSKNDYFKLHKTLPEGTVFPVDVGFVPQTKAGDGDPLDVFIFMEGLTYPGCIVECRATGIIEVEQEYQGRKYRNDRIIAVPIKFCRAQVDFRNYRYCHRHVE